MKDDKLYLTHILESIDNILSYTPDLDQQLFLENKLVQDACIRNLEIIGETSKKINQDLRNENQDIEWRQMAGMRDKLIHDYFGVDLGQYGQLLKTYYQI